MKVYDIPAYAYYGTQSYRNDVFLVCDDKLCKYINEVIDPNPNGVFRTMWSASGGNYASIFRKVNEVLGSPIFSPNHRLYQPYNDNSGVHFPTQAIRLESDLGITLDYYKINNDFTIPNSGTNYSPTRIVTLNGYDLYVSQNIGYRVGNVNIRHTYANGHNDFMSYCRQENTSTIYTDISYIIAVYPERLFANNQLIDRATFEGDDSIPIPVYISVTASYHMDSDYISFTDLYAYSVAARTYSKRNVYNDLSQLLGDFTTVNSGMQEKDYDDSNPYGTDGTSDIGGGDGTLPAGGLDYIDPTEIPEIPTLSAANCGFMTIYNPSVAQLQALASFMWSGAFDLDTYKKLFSDPMESIIGLAIVPVAPDIGGAKNVMFGTIDSGVNMSYVSSQYKKVNCGSVDIQKYVGCFMDYSPYTKISIYLPYIGIRDLSPDDITGGSINVTYIVDVLSGACACFISHSTKGVLYSFNGSCISNIPLTSANFSGAIQNAVSAVIGGVGVIAGVATGAAPVTAMGAMGLLNSAANTAMNSKPHIQRSGNLGGSAGIMSVQKPFIIIERPNLSVPSNVQHYVGQTSNLTRNLGNCSGFTMVEYIHLHDIPATSEELSEIETLLKQGVIL